MRSAAEGRACACPGAALQGDQLQQRLLLTLQLELELSLVALERFRLVFGLEGLPDLQLQIAGQGLQSVGMGW